MKSLDRVRRHFERDAARFDAVYAERKPLLQRFVDAQRRVVVRRYELITNLAPVPGAWTALDVGCGPGRYAIALAQRGATRVLGVDVAPTMIEIARAAAEREAVADRCEFRVSSFADFHSDERFDAVVATGYFDYIEEPRTHVDKMVRLSRGRIFASFPKRYDWRAPLRKARFALARGYVRFYTEHEVRRLFGQAGLAADRLSLVDLGRDWIAIVRTS